MQEKITRLNDVPKYTGPNINVNKRNHKDKLKKRKKDANNLYNKEVDEFSTFFLPCSHIGQDRRDSNIFEKKTRISQECLFIHEQRLKINSIQL